MLLTQSVKQHLFSLMTSIFFERSFTFLHLRGLDSKSRSNKRLPSGRLSCLPVTLIPSQGHTNVFRAVEFNGINPHTKFKPDRFMNIRIHANKRVFFCCCWWWWWWWFFFFFFFFKAVSKTASISLTTQNITLKKHLPEMLHNNIELPADQLKRVRENKTSRLCFRRPCDPKPRSKSLKVV